MKIFAKMILRLIILSFLICGAIQASEVDPFQIAFGFLSIGEPNSAYNEQLNAEGGTPPYKDWRIVKGKLPPGLILNPNSGLISGTPLEEGLYNFLVEVEDSSFPPITDREYFAIRIGGPSAGFLLQKAEEYNRIYQERHSPDGLSLIAEVDPDTNKVHRYGSHGDAAIWTGTYGAAAACRYAVTKSPDAWRDLKKVVRAMDTLRRITGKPGLLARGFEARETMESTAGRDDVEFGSTHPEQHDGSGEFADYRWEGDVSRDQYIGIFFGWGIIYDLIENTEIRKTAMENISELADHIWDNELRIIDVDGYPTTHGELSGERYAQLSPKTLYGTRVANGFNALLCLNFFKLAHHVSKEERFKRIYNFLLEERQYIGKMDQNFVVYIGYGTKWFNVNLSFMNFFNLIRLEQAKSLTDEYISRFEKFLWLPGGENLSQRHARDELNSFFNILYCVTTGERQPEALYDAIWQLTIFTEPPNRNRRVENSSNPDIEQNPRKRGWALEALPVNLRPSTDFIWQRNPYRLDGGADNNIEWSGLDYITAYWLGRYYGFISKDW